MNSLSLFSHMLDPEVDRRFALLCDVVDGLALPGLIEDIQQHVLNVHKALEFNEFLDVGMAEKIAALLKKLLGEINKYPESKKKMIIGAVRYFVKSNDAQADLTSLLGFDDDVAVLNYVLVELGHADLRLPL